MTCILLISLNFTSILYLFTIFGPRLKTEGSYRIASVPSLVTVVYRKQLKQFFWNLACRGHLRLKTYPSGFFRFYVICVILAKNRKKWPKNEVIATFLKNGSNDFSRKFDIICRIMHSRYVPKISPQTKNLRSYGPKRRKGHRPKIFQFRWSAYFCKQY